MDLQFQHFGIPDMSMKYDIFHFLVESTLLNDLIRLFYPHTLKHLQKFACCDLVQFDPKQMLCWTCTLGTNNRLKLSIMEKKMQLKINGLNKLRRPQPNS